MSTALESNRSEINRDVVAYFWDAYFDWRSKYGLQDECMRELVAAIRVQIDSHIVTGHTAARLKKLAHMIESEIGAKQHAQDSRAA
jgi:hypothetical protein